MGNKSCYLLDADTKHGEYKVWISPDQGYSVIKMEHHEKEGDLGDRGTPFPPGYRMDFTFEISKLKEINGVWFPVEGIMKTDGEVPQIAEYQKNQFHIWLSDIVINPEFTEEDFGNGDVLNGAKVTKNGLPVRYQWQDGKLVPMDEE